ncbi:MAG: hypothetical protein DI533_05715 [Cereibacter sphaeroides]|uniref:Cytochrome-c oxidase n=1 Tax=Cereibacter sphaeroides TaxID=1063 RepID=A0A2W5UQN4_CERSP|nr:MAG: hypothetical protein DI533_05715 [Cereibacter sphaeroides]
MNIARGFLVTAPIYLIVGFVIGGYMAGSQDHSLAPAHAHINLLGFTLMMAFGLFYAVFPAANDTRLAQVHFWLHQAGTLILSVLLVLLFSGRIAEPDMAPLAPISIIALLIGAVCFLINVIRFAR